MPITVRLFASLKAKHGHEASVSAQTPLSVSELVDALRVGGLWHEGCRVAVNQAFASPSDTVLEGDEVAVIPPVSGG